MTRLLKEGQRKFAVLAGAMAFCLIVASLFVTFGPMKSAEWAAFCLEVLKWGGGIFAAGNALEHGAKALRKVKGDVEKPTVKG